MVSAKPPPPISVANSIKETLIDTADAVSIWFSVKSLSCKTICDDELLKKLIEYKIDLGTLARVITKEFVDEMHGYGIEINAVVIDDPKEAERLVACGVDYITTNRLE